MWSNEVLHALLIVFVYSNKLTAVDSCEVNDNGSGDDNITDIHIIGFFPCTDPNDTRGIPVDNCDGIERIPIMRLALEEINGRCDLLPGYRLVVDYANSAVSIEVMHLKLATLLSCSVHQCQQHIILSNKLIHHNQLS